jgi:hypothetical protein
MTDPRLATLVEHTFSRADLAYRIGVLKEFLEFMFFKAHATKVSKEVMEAYEKKGHAVADLAFLRSLPGSFFDDLTQESFYAALDGLSAAAQKLPMLALTIPVMLDSENRDAIGAWVRRELGKDVLLDLSTDPEVGVGCQMVWHDQLHDFDFDHYLEANREKIEERIARTVPRAPFFARS